MQQKPPQLLFRNVTEAVAYEGGAYYLSCFLYLDSLYKANSNPPFDIGEPVKVKAYALNQWKVSEQVVALTVLIDFKAMRPTLTVLSRR